MTETYPKNIRLYELIHNEDTVNNLLNIYKTLRGKENLSKRIFLKTLVYNALNRRIPPKEDNIMWIQPETFFSPNAGRWMIDFNVYRFEEYWKSYKENPSIFSFYGKLPKVNFGKLV